MHVSHARRLLPLFILRYPGAAMKCGTRFCRACIPVPAGPPCEHILQFPEVLSLQTAFDSMLALLDGCHSVACLGKFWGQFVVRAIAV
jgi:hypothetical protein